MIIQPGLAKIEGFSSFEEFKNGKIKNHKQIWSIISEDKNEKIAIFYLYFKC